MALLLLPVAFFVLGVAVGRRWVVLAAVGLWGALALFLVVNDGWHGAGWGDFGIELNILLALLTVAAAVAGVGARAFATRGARAGRRERL